VRECFVINLDRCIHGFLPPLAFYMVLTPDLYSLRTDLLSLSLVWPSGMRTIGRADGQARELLVVLQASLGFGSVTAAKLSMLASCKFGSASGMSHSPGDGFGHATLLDGSMPCGRQQL
jgi:hypothetical protein